ncbi:hypothetical protein K490DRAFT_59922 [Saccharata proteae CBS 121410]|uniref:Uncharacterized protein n=1 Tax=Saccharata proteae CBS 121410 TaxID=1314787 RepID=A0A9P4HR16_9PEZI|nr:hypothetical protein K490DRAFT_59922 [Saccharata proteae CBS 121410]
MVEYFVVRGNEVWFPVSARGGDQTCDGGKMMAANTASGPEYQHVSAIATMADVELAKGVFGMDPLFTVEGVLVVYLLPRLSIWLIRLRKSYTCAMEDSNKVDED